MRDEKEAMNDEELQELADFYFGGSSRIQVVQVRSPGMVCSMSADRHGDLIQKAVVMAEETAMQAMFPGLGTTLVLDKLNAPSVCCVDCSPTFDTRTGENEQPHVDSLSSGSCEECK